MRKHNANIIDVLALLPALVIAATINYLLFHTVVEGYVVIVSFSIYILGTRTYRHSGNELLLFLAHVFFLVGVLSSFHLLAYLELGIFPASANLASQIGIGARALEALAFAFTPTVALRRGQYNQVYLWYFLSAGFMLSSILILTLISSIETTLVLRILVCTLIAVSFLHLTANRGRLERNLYLTLAASMIIALTSEVVLFTLPSLWGSVIGHSLKLASYLVLSYGVVIHGLQKPFELITHQIVEERSRASQEFIQVLTHELRNPLTAIGGISSLLLLEHAKGKPIPSLSAKLELLCSEVKHLAGLIDEISDAFRSGKGGRQMEKARIDMSSLIKSVLAPLISVGSHRYTLELNTSFQAQVLGDARRLEEVLRNLVSNAQKYSPSESEIKIRLSCTNQHVIVAVSDQGIGIPKKQLHKVFDGFFRAQNFAGQDPGGMGLGLYICKNLIEQHGGEIWVESTEGLGSTFHFLLPRVQMEKESA